MTGKQSSKKTILVGVIGNTLEWYDFLLYAYFARLCCNKVEIATYIRSKLESDWSPEQISGHAKRLGLFSISHERIYQYVLVDKQQGGELYKHLRYQHKSYRKRYGSPKREGPIRNRRMIDQHPSIVDEKTRIGDWEIDTIIGKNRKQAVLSIVDRVSKFTFLKKLEVKSSNAVRIALQEIFSKQTAKVKTITANNGSEFARHEEISRDLNADFFFAHPHSSWERGLNENTNGLVRQYLKKGCEFNKVTDKSLALITEKLNSWPRKLLGYRTPGDLYFKTLCS
jgi:IS30 family transposase